MKFRICRHPLQVVAYAPQWLTCVTCRADFPHKKHCPGYGTELCLADCARGGSLSSPEELAAWFALPAVEPRRDRSDR